ncbi:GatB/YqeY domain-containing protein [candidate division KSB1 bacterium]|nr:GatB/YqeY domain-containing protein [candidate division KSB1 bacterium]
MTIRDQISDDIKLAMKSGDTFKRDTLRLIISQIKYAQIDKNADLNDDEVISILMNAAKKRQEAIDLYEKGNRPDLKLKEQQELDIISLYLPKKISDAELDAAISNIIKKVGAQTIKDLGKVMAEIMKDFKNQVDGKKAQELVRQKLG